VRTPVRCGDAGLRLVALPSPVWGGVTPQLGAMWRLMLRMRRHPTRRRSPLVLTVVSNPAGCASRSGAELPHVGAGT
jgi:hypothetical protein